MCTLNLSSSSLWIEYLTNLFQCVQWSSGRGIRNPGLSWLLAEQGALYWTGGCFNIWIRSKFVFPFYFVLGSSDPGIKCRIWNYLGKLKILKEINYLSLFLILINVLNLDYKFYFTKNESEDYSLFRALEQCIVSKYGFNFFTYLQNLNYFCPNTWVILTTCAANSMYWWCFTGFVEYNLMLLFFLIW